MVSRWSKGFGLRFWRAPAAADFHDAEVQARLEALPCGGATLGARLAEESRIHSRRDLGWRFFTEGDAMEAERSFRVSKSMETRYRWRVGKDGQVEALTDQARQLCP